MIWAMMQIMGDDDKEGNLDDGEDNGLGLDEDEGEDKGEYECTKR